MCLTRGRLALGRACFFWRGDPKQKPRTLPGSRPFKSDSAAPSGRRALRKISRGLKKEGGNLLRGVPATCDTAGYSPTLSFVRDYIFVDRQVNEFYWTQQLSSHESEKYHFG